MYLNTFWLIYCCKENWKLINTGKSRLYRAASPCLWTPVLFAAMCKPLPQSKFHLPNAASLALHVHSTLRPQDSAQVFPKAVWLFLAGQVTSSHTVLCSALSVPKAVWLLQVISSHTVLCSALSVTTSPSTASRPWMPTAPWGLEGIPGGSRYSCEWPPLRKPVTLPADMMVKPGCASVSFLVYVVCEVWIIVSTKGICLPGVLFVLSLQFAICFLVMLSSLAVEILHFSFTCKLFLLSHVN